VVIRQNVFSGIYLLLVLVAPFLPKPTPRNLLKGSVGIYFKVLLLFSTLICGSLFVYQIVIFATHKHYKDALNYCEPEGELLSLIGFNRLDGISPFSVFRLFVIDFLILIYIWSVYFVSRRIFRKYYEQQSTRELVNDEVEASPVAEDKLKSEEDTAYGSDLHDCSLDSKLFEQNKRRRLRRLTAIGIAKFLSELLFNVLLCGAAVLNPSITSSFYLFLFIFIATWISCNKKLGSAFEKFRIFVCFFIFAQLMVLFIYQMDFFRNSVEPDNLYARLFGLTDYVTSNCTTARDLRFKQLNWNIFAHPFFLIALYFLSASLVCTRVFQKKKVNERNEKTIGANRQTICSPSKCDKKVLNKSGEKLLMSSSSANKSSPANIREVDIDGEGANGNSLPLHEYSPTCLDTTPLLSTSQQKTYKTLRQRPSLNLTERSGLDVDSNGSVIWKNESQDVMNIESPDGKRSSIRVDTPNTPGGKADKSSKLAPILYVLNIIKKSSYAGTLITWSITYHSWLTFVLLLWSCLIWMVPNSRQACLKSSPFLVLYAVLLILAQYIFSLQLTDEELPEQFDHVSLIEIGLRKYGDVSYKPLLVKILYTLMFWITLRQYAEEKQKERIESQAAAGATRTSIPRHMSLATTLLPANFSPTLLWISNEVRALLVKYWIWIVACMLMVMSMSGDRVVLFRIGYMFLFLSFVLMFQFSYRLWRRMVYSFWLVVIVYSMAVLIAIYTYQFDNFPRYWKAFGASKQIQLDIGLESYKNNPWSLFTHLFTPTFFLIITIIQVHFLHKDFMELSKYEDQSVTLVASDETRLTSSARTNSSLAHGSDEHKNQEVALDLEMADASSSTISDLQSSKQSKSPQTGENSSTFVTPEHQTADTKNKGNVRISEAKQVAYEFKSKAQHIWDSIKPTVYYFYEIFWRFLEIHLIKLIYLCAMIAAISEVSLVNSIFIILVVLGLPFQRFEKAISYAFGIWASILILAKMAFQLSISSDLSWESNCTEIRIFNDVVCESAILLNETIDNRRYIGFRKVKNVSEYISKDILIVIILTLNTVVLIRQSIHRLRHNEQCPPQGIIFPNITRKEADKGIVECLKYFANYFFYKFGLEITAFVIVLLIAYRIDIVALIAAFWLMIFGLSSRIFVSKIWPIFVGMMCILLPLEYFICIGIPPGLCTQYPWCNWPRALLIWLYLPSFTNLPNAHEIYFDFFVLLFATRQLFVFCIEKSCTDYDGGDNSEFGTPSFIRTKGVVTDYFTFKRTQMDTLKSLFFSCFYWITLAVLFLTAIGYFNLFGLGYILGCFLFLWSGNEFYLKPVNKIVKIWKLLIAYTITVIFIKIILDLIGCLFTKQLEDHYCLLVHLFGISCSQNSDSKIFIKCNTSPTQQANSEPQTDDFGMYRDGVCLIFLLIQKRIFGSHYFSYLVKEIKAQHVLASRGAELIHEIQAKEVMEQEEAEREVMEKIKMKVDKIRSRQQKVSDGKSQKIKTHYQDDYVYDLSPCYSTAEATMLHTPEAEEHPLCSTLPSIFSPTPSLPTALSPSSAASPAEGKGYLEIFKIPLRHIDEGSSVKTAQSASPRSSPVDETPFYSPAMCSPVDPPSDPFKMHSNAQLNAEFSITSRPSFRLHQKPSRPVSRIASFRRKPSSNTSMAASHGSSVRSGDYHMFEDPDAEEIDLEKKPRKSLIPDPVGDELKRIANAKGLTAFCSKLVKGQITEDDEAVAKFSGESTDVGDSSKDSAIVSVDRDVVDSDASAITTYTSVPSSIPEEEFIPSTSKASAMDEISEKRLISDASQEVAADEETKTKTSESSETILQKLKRWILIAALFLKSCIISATSQLNDVSRDYRYVSRRLAVEKKALKVLFEMEESEGVHYDIAWKKETLQKISKASVPQITKSKGSNDTLLKQKGLVSADSEVPKTKRALSPEDEEDEYCLHSNSFIRFIRATFYAVVSQSEFVCYSLVVINQIINGSLLSLPLPLMVFLWGCLSVPRPTKTFWISVITYTEAIVIAKYIFNFRWIWRDVGSLPKSFPQLIGIDASMSSQYFIDLALLLVLFFHRFMLKSLGLWDLEVDFGKPKSKEESNEGTLVSNNDLKNEDLTQAPGLRRRKVQKDPTLEELKEKCESSSEETSNEELEEYETVNQVLEVSTTFKESFQKLLEPMNLFFQRILHPDFRITCDLYSAMFFCDFINFFIVVFGYNSFGSGYGDASITTYFEENRVPILFLLMLLASFMVILIDRALYLRKNIIGRLIFHIVIVIIIHVYLFIILPSVADRNTSPFDRNPPKFWYIFKAIYLLLNARQIKCGYTMIPFLYDMRLIMDWVWTDTSLNLEEWAIMEDMFKQLFERKCTLTFEKKFPEPEGRARRRPPKYFHGGAYLALILLAIWIPLVLFALGSTVGKSLNPSTVTVSIEFVGFQPLFKMSATGDMLQERLTEDEWSELKRQFESSSAIAFLDSYSKEDVSVAWINGNSTFTWTISPPSESDLISRLSSNETMFMKITWYVTRSHPEIQEAGLTVYKSNEIEITKDDIYRHQIAQLLKQEKRDDFNQTDYITVPQFFPNFVKVVAKKDPKAITDLTPSAYRDINITVIKGDYFDDNISVSQWWEIRERYCKGDKGYPFAFLKKTSCDYLPIVFFSEKIFTGTLGKFMSGYGILGFYTTFVFLLSRIIRGMFDNLSYNVIYTQMPCVDRVLQLCLDIYLVRERREFGLEEDLYAKLIFLYRSPETLIKWTKEIEEPQIVERQ
ncbi:Piezo-type mechanosensitive ion channel component 2-like protein, partial [Dinothrombium tinctorium]